MRSNPNPYPLVKTDVVNYKTNKSNETKVNSSLSEKNSKNNIDNKIKSINLREPMKTFLNLKKGEKNNKNQNEKPLINGPLSIESLTEEQRQEFSINDFDLDDDVKLNGRFNNNYLKNHSFN